MKTSDFAYDLPPELIAQTPIPERDRSRLMCLDKKTGALEHRHFYELPTLLKAGDCLVINDSRVLPARLLGRRPTGGVSELVLLRDLGDNIWECLCRPGKHLREGAEILFGEGELRARIEEVLPDGNRRVRFFYEGIFLEVLDRLGKMPLPPYIKEELQDRERYQTVYSRELGSAAAPTAQHEMHAEYCIIPEETAKAVNACRENGGRVIAVGTTSCRTLESFADENGRLKPSSGWTDIFIYPGYRFRCIDGLITNFHLPESTLIMLVSALAGREQVLNAYRVAVEERYRFFSFGDAMFIA